MASPRCKAVRLWLAPRHAAALRAALAVAALLGVFLIVFPLAISLPDKSAASGDLMNARRPQISDAALAQGRAHQQTMQAMGGEPGCWRPRCTARRPRRTR